MFNKELFLELCQNYGVQFSEDSDTIMYLDSDGELRPLLTEDTTIAKD